MGVLSFGFDCSSEQPVLSTNIAYSIEWIQNVTSKDLNVPSQDHILTPQVQDNKSWSFFKWLSFIGSFLMFWNWPSF